MLTTNLALARIVESLRDWGRDCWCEPGEANTCVKRFECQLGTLPQGYDHKYIYSHVGYNLKATDLQAALGLASSAKLDEFIAARRRNWQRLRERLRRACRDLLLPEATPDSDPSWFGFAVTVEPGAPFSRARAGRLPGGPQDRHPAAVRRQPHPAPGLPRPARTGSSATLTQQRHHHRADLLDRRLPGPHRRDDRLCRDVDLGVRRRPGMRAGNARRRDDEFHFGRPRRPPDPMSPTPLRKTTRHPTAAPTYPS